MWLQEEEEMSPVVSINENANIDSVKLLASSQILCSYLTRPSQTQNRVSDYEWKAVLAACKYLEQKLNVQEK